MSAPKLQVSMQIISTVVYSISYSCMRPWRFCYASSATSMTQNSDTQDRSQEDKIGGQGCVVCIQAKHPEPSTPMAAKSVRLAAHLVVVSPDESLHEKVGVHRCECLF